MTTEQKLSIFYKTALEQATSEKERILADYKQTLALDFDKKKQDFTTSLLASYEQKVQLAKQEINKDFSKETQQFRIQYNKRRQELTNQLLDGVRVMLTEYKASSKYMHLLETMIKDLKVLDSDGSLQLYIDASDTSRKEYLERKLDVTLHIYPTQMLGGIIAKLPKQNLFVDESFQTKLNEQKEKYSLERKEGS